MVADCVNVCVCCIMITVPLLKAGWKQTFVILDRFFKWKSVAGLQRPAVPLPSPLPPICPLAPIRTHNHLLNGSVSLITSLILIDLYQFVSHQGFPEQRSLCHITHNINALLRLENSLQSVCHSLGYRAKRYNAVRETGRQSTEKDRERKKETNDNGHVFLSMLVMRLLSRKLAPLLSILSSFIKEISQDVSHPWVAHISAYMMMLMLISKW